MSIITAEATLAERGTGGSRSPVGSVPRITLSAFCETEETALALKAAFGDRRMSRAHCSGHMGGIATAVDTYASATTPALIIVENQADRTGLLEDLARLAEICDPKTKVVVIGHVNDVTLYRELISQGVSEYVVAPIDPVEVVDCALRLFGDPKATPLGRIYAFVGAKGGVGSSTVAHNVGWTISEELDEDVVITDLDLAFGTAGLNFNQDTPQGIVEALSAPERVDDVLIERLLTKCNDHLSLLAAPGSVEREFDLESDALETILGVVRHNVPCVIVDVPNIWTHWTKETLKQADELVITATPDLACLRNTKNLVDFLKNARPNDPPPKVVLNQVGVPKRPEISPQEFAAAVGVESVVILPYDPQLFTNAANNGQMIGEMSNGAKVAKIFESIASDLTGRRKVTKPSALGLGQLLGKLTFKKSG